MTTINENIPNQIAANRMDWHLFWVAAGVVLSLGSMIFGCYKSLNNSLQNVDRRLTVIETTLILKGIMPKDVLSAKEGE